MPRAAPSASSVTSPFKLQSRQQVPGHEELLRWAIGPQGLETLLRAFSREFDLNEGLRKSAEALRSSIEEAIEGCEEPPSPKQVALWRKIPDLRLVKTVSAWSAEVRPGVAQLIAGSGDRLRPGGVCDITVDIWRLSPPYFSVPELEGFGRFFAGNVLPEIEDPLNELQCSCEKSRTQVVVNCYPKATPTAVLIDDLALLANAKTHAGDVHNSAENILFVVEDETQFAFLGKSCNVILHRDGKVAGHNLRYLERWIADADRQRKTGSFIIDLMAVEGASPRRGKRR